MLLWLTKGVRKTQRLDLGGENMRVFDVILSVDKNTNNDHYYQVKTHEEVINLINWAKEKNQKIKKITEREIKEVTK